MASTRVRGWEKEPGRSRAIRKYGVAKSRTSTGKEISSAPAARSRGCGERTTRSTSAITNRWPSPAGRLAGRSALSLCRLAALQGRHELLLLVLGQGRTQHGWSVGGQGRTDPVGRRPAYECEDRRRPRRDRRRDLLHEPVVDTDVPQLSAGGPGGGADGHPEQRHEEQQAQQHPPQGAARRTNGRGADRLLDLDPAVRRTPHQRRILQVQQLLPAQATREIHHLLGALLVGKAEHHELAHVHLLRAAVTRHPPSTRMLLVRSASSAATTSGIMAWKIRTSTRALRTRSAAGSWGARTARTAATRPSSAD